MKSITPFDVAVETKLWPQIDQRGDDECWEWQGSNDGRGYGQIKIGGRRGKLYKTHRLIWELINGPIPDGLEVCHTCDNPPCCNPAHLFLGTHEANMEDCKSKGRHAHGERHPCAILTDQQVIDARNRYAQRLASLEEIAGELGVSWATARAAISGQNFRHLPMPDGPDLRQLPKAARPRLTEGDARSIKRRLAAGESRRAIAEDLDIPYRTICSIAVGQRWKSVDENQTAK